jgi:hypothetical protein
VAVEVGRVDELIPSSEPTNRNSASARRRGSGGRFGRPGHWRLDGCGQSSQESDSEPRNAAVAEVTGVEDLYRVRLWLGAVEQGIQFRRVELPKEVDPEEWPSRARAIRGWSPVRLSPISTQDLENLSRRAIDTDAFDAVWKTPNPF